MGGPVCHAYQILRGFCLECLAINAFSDDLSAIYCD
jgi:hypothetical protein